MTDRAPFQLAGGWQPEWLTSKTLAQKAHDDNRSLGVETLVDAINNEPEKNENKRTGLLNLLICKLDLQGSDGKGRRDEQLLKAFKPGWQPQWGNDGEPPPFKEESLYEQSLIMHFCATILPEYDALSCSVEKHCQLNQLLVPLLKKIFDRPDVAWLAYERYHEGDHENPVANLYRELGTILRMQSKATKDREALLVELKNPANQNEDSLAEAIKKTISRIIHADDENKEAWPKSPSSKLSRLAQLTCLIRERDESKGGDPNKRKYTSYLAGIGYKRIEIIDEKYAPYELKWPPQDEDRSKRFHQALDLNYSEGHDSQFLQKFFSGDQSGAVWVQDGEITFFWLLEAIRRLKEKSDAIAVITSQAICSKENSDVRLVVGDNFQTFVTKYCILFSKDLTPTWKFWALVNFLNRLVCSQCPFFEDARVGQLAESLLQKLKEAKSQSECFAKLDEWQKDRESDLQVDPRLKTFLLEAILRSEDPYPYTLFFLPLSFDVYHKATLPSAFLGGTFGGLEWDSFPSVTSRQNLHLYAIIDAIRPAIDEEVGRVMRKDRDAYIEKLDTDKLFKTIQPHLTSLSEIIKQAQNKIELIDSNLDTDWGGILKAEVSPVIPNLFVTNRAFEFTDHKRNRHTFEGQHNSKHWDDKFVDSAFHYLFRQVVGDARRPWNKARAGLKGTAFKDHLFLGSLWEYYYTESPKSPPGDVAKKVMQLLKILVVEAGQKDRGVYPAQIYAALGRTLNQQYLPYNVLTKNGVERILETQDVHTANTYRLLADSKPSSFLKSLRSLVVALPHLGDGSKSVGIETIDVAFEADQCLISLDCAGKFDTKFQRLLFEYMTEDVKEYHDLRSAVLGIAKTVGNPIFGKNSKPSIDEPFVFSSDNDAKTTIGICLKADRIIQNKGSGSKINKTISKSPADHGSVSQFRFLEIPAENGGQSTDRSRLARWELLQIAEWSKKDSSKDLILFAHANDLFSRKILGELLDDADCDWDRIRDHLGLPRQLVLYSGGDVAKQKGDNERICAALFGNLPSWVTCVDFVQGSAAFHRMVENWGIAGFTMEEQMLQLKALLQELDGSADLSSEDSRGMQEDVKDLLRDLQQGKKREDKMKVDRFLGELRGRMWSSQVAKLLAHND